MHLTHPGAIRDFFPDVIRSFRREGDGYISHNVGTLSCPPYIIAGLAEQAPLWPKGYTKETWDQIRWLCGWYGKDVAVSLRQGEELAAMGRHLLELADRIGEDKLRLTYDQRASISYLLRVVQTS